MHTPSFSGNGKNSNPWTHYNERGGEERGREKERGRGGGEREGVLSHVSAHGHLSIIIILLTLFTQHACARGKVIDRVVVVTQKSPNLEIWALERVVSTINMSNLAKNWLQYAQNQGARPTSVTNSVLVGYRSHAHQWCPRCIMHVLSALMQDWPCRCR